jgi:hypothetical protein
LISGEITSNLIFFQIQKTLKMATLDKKTKKQVLIPTQDSKYPFVFKLQDDAGFDEYWLIKADGTLTGDRFLYKEKETYPQFLSNI